MLGAIASAFGMNLEGRDDWMTEFPPGVEVFASGEDQRPLPSPPCPVTWEMVRANPYEQIPLPRHGCGQARAELSHGGVTTRV
jgi:hypothetical protein